MTSGKSKTKLYQPARKELQLQGRAARQVFAAVKKTLKDVPESRKYLEKMLRFNIIDANPSRAGDRFAFGEGAEEAFAIACRAAGYSGVYVAGHNQVGVDLLDQGDHVFRLSSKASGKKNPSEWTISNGANGAGCGMAAPTVFLSTVIGGWLLVDPYLHTSVVKALVERKSDTQLPNSVLMEHKERNPRLFIPLDLLTAEQAKLLAPQEKEFSRTRKYLSLHREDMDAKEQEWWDSKLG